MTKVLVVGDLHGKSVWKRAVERIQYDTVTFVGDYVNASSPLRHFEDASNLRELIAFKRRNPDSVNLLIGNHDLFFLLSAFNSSKGSISFSS